MPPPPPIPRVVLTAFAVLALAGCQPGSAHPEPSVPQNGGDLKCSSGDHTFEDPQAGWGFCYPNGWRYTERSQASSSPTGLDLTFDVTYVPASPRPCASPAAGAKPSPCSGDFGFMILSTYERGDAADLQSWAQANLKPTPPLEAISWGNAVEAARLPDGRRLALTPHHVVVMDLHSGLLDLEGEMSSRLATWKFSF